MSSPYTTGFATDAVVTPVVAGCILEDNLVLISKRSSSKEPSILGKWEFPGGTVRFGESFMDALKREIKEELNLSIEVEGLLHAQINTYDSGKDYLVLYYKCTSIGKVEGLGAHLQWVPLRNIAEGEWDVLPGTVEASRVLFWKDLERYI